MRKRFSRLSRRLRRFMRTSRQCSLVYLELIFVASLCYLITMLCCTTAQSSFIPRLVSEENFQLLTMNNDWQRQEVKVLRLRLLSGQALGQTKIVFIFPRSNPSQLSTCQEPIPSMPTSITKSNSLGTSPWLTRPSRHPPPSPPGQSTPQEWGKNTTQTLKPTPLNGQSPLIS